MREPKPWLRKANKCWYVQICGKQVRLGADRAKAHQRFHTLMAANATPTDSFPGLAKAFLEWTRANRSAGTYSFYADHLKTAVRYIRVSGDQLRPHHLDKWLTLYAGTSNNYRRNAIRSVQRVLNWAVQQGYLGSAPKLPKPKQEARTCTITDEQYRQLLGNAHPAARKLIIALREIGARPLSLRQATVDHLQGSRIIIPEGKGARPEIIHLTPRCELNTEGYLFTNSRGKPWTKSALTTLALRLSKKCDFHFTFYSLRHTFATAAIQGGMDSLIVARLMNHTDTKMLNTIYFHADAAFLEAQAASLVTPEVEL